MHKQDFAVRSGETASVNAVDANVYNTTMDVNVLSREFRFEDHNIRVIFRGDTGEPWWVLLDVCGVLGIVNSRDAAARLDDDEKDDVGITDVIGRSQQMVIINESGLYSLILTARKPEAKRFRKWVTSEVLPAIRKTGGYSISKGFTREERLAQAILDASAVLAEREQRVAQLEFQNSHLTRTVAEQTPKVEFYDTAVAIGSTFSMGEVAKNLLPMPPYGKKPLGQNQLFEWLRRHQILMANNKPYQKYVDAGWFEVKLVPSRGGNFPVHQTRVTIEGENKLRQRLIENGFECAGHIG